MPYPLRKLETLYNEFRHRNIGVKSRLEQVDNLVKQNIAECNSMTSSIWQRNTLDMFRTILADTKIQPYHKRKAELHDKTANGLTLLTTEVAVIHHRYDHVTSSMRSLVRIADNESGGVSRHLFKQAGNLMQRLEARGVELPQETMSEITCEVLPVMDSSAPNQKNRSDMLEAYVAFKKAGEYVLNSEEAEAVDYICDEYEHAIQQLPSWQTKEKAHLVRISNALNGLRAK